MRFANKMSFTLVAGMVNTSAVEEYGGNGVKGGGRVYKSTVVGSVFDRGRSSRRYSYIKAASSAKSLVTAIKPILH